VSGVAAPGDVTIVALDRVALAIAPGRAVAGTAPNALDERASRGLPADRRREFCAARTLLRYLLAETIDPAAAAGAIAKGRGGQPSLVDRRDLAISLSHSQGYVAAAVGRGVPVGIDVQFPVQVSRALIARCCARDAQADLERLDDGDRELEFAWIWTVQEACVKASGAGLAGQPWTIPVGYAQDEGQWRSYRWRRLRDHSQLPVSVAYGRELTPTR
jgi:4'-phosphopantetheinyl transferase